jgi:hypothetical protein
MSIEGAFNLPFKEAQKYIEGKKQVLPTETWRDITQSAHSKAFVIAGVSNLELLTDVHGIIAEQMKNGVSFSDFRKNFRQKVAEKGWVKFETETRKYQAWRTKIIYNTNMQAAFAAGKWQQITSDNSKINFPFLQYVHNYYGTSKTPRADHLAWNGVVLPVDDAFWQTHYPPNGFGCKCGVKQLTKSEGEDKLKRMYNSTHADKIENFADNYGEEKALKTMRKYAGAFSSQDAALEKSGWAYNVGADDAKGYLSLFDKLTAIESKGAQYVEFVEKAWQSISDKSPEIFKDSLKLWNEKHYGNKGTKTGSENRRVAGITSKERLAEMNKIFKERTGSDLLRNPVISISEKQFEHSVRIEAGHTTPPKEFFSKIAQAVENGRANFVKGSRGAQNSVNITFENVEIVIYRNGIVHTFYAKKTGG